MSGCASARFGVESPANRPLLVPPLVAAPGERRMNRTGLGLLALLTPLVLLIAPAVSAQPAEPYTWDRLIAEVEAGHPLIDAAEAGLEQLEKKLSQAEWAIFPSFELTGAATITPTVTGDPLTFESDWGTIGLFGQVKLEMVQPLWTFGKIGALQQAATIGVQIGQTAVDIARWELRSRAAEAYLGRLLARELDLILVDGQSWIEKAEKRMEKLKEDDSDEYDQLEHLRLKTRVAEFWQLALDNRMLVTQTQTGLRLLLRKPAGTPVELAEKNLEPYVLEVQDAEVYVELMRRSDPAIRLAKKNAAAQQALANAKSKELFPDLVLVGQIGITRANRIEDQHSPFANDPYNTQSAGAALGLRWELDVPQKVLQADEAHARARRAAAEALVQEDLQELRVRQLAMDLKNKSELVTIYADSQKAAQGWLAATWDTYDAGFGSFRDVMDALVQFYQNKFGYLKVVFDHNVVAWKLSQAVGTDIRGLKKAPTPRPTPTPAPAPGPTRAPAPAPAPTSTSTSTP